MLNNKLFSLACCLVIASLLTAQSPWVREKKGYYAQVGYATIPAYSELFPIENGQKLYRAVSESTIQLYGEYGVSERLTAILSAPFVMVGTGDSVLLPNLPTVTPAGSLSGFGNIDLGAKYKLSKVFPLSFNLIASLPTDSKNAATGLRTGYDAFGISPSVSVGLGTKRSFIYGNFGGTFRSNNFSTSAFARVEGGYKFGDLYLILGLDVLNSQENGTATGENVLTGLYVDKQSWVGFGLKLNYEIKKQYGITLWGNGASSGNNVPKSPSIGLSIYAKSLD